MTHPYRRECSDLVSTILKREISVVFGGESSAVVPGRKGVCLLLTTGARKATEVDLCRDAVIEGLYDIADNEGVDGSMILYNIGFKFAVDPNGPLGPNGTAQSQSQTHSQESANGSERGETRSEGKREDRPGRSQSRRSSQQSYAPRGTSRGPPPPSSQPQRPYYDDGYEERLRGRFAPRRSASTKDSRSYSGAYPPREEYGRDPRDRFYKY